MADHLTGWSFVSREITFAGTIAPGAFRIPVPGLHEKIGVLAIADGSPSCREHLLDLIGTEKDVGGVAGNTIDGGSQRTKRAEPVYDMTGGCIDRHSLGDGLHVAKKNIGKNEDTKRLDRHSHQESPSWLMARVIQQCRLSRHDIGYAFSRRKIAIRIIISSSHFQSLGLYNLPFPD